MVRLGRARLRREAGARGRVAHAWHCRPAGPDRHPHLTLPHLVRRATVDRRVQVDCRACACRVVCCGVAAPQARAWAWSGGWTHGGACHGIKSVRFYDHARRVLEEENLDKRCGACKRLRHAGTIQLIPLSARQGMNNIYDILSTTEGEAARRSRCL